MSTTLKVLVLDDSVDVAQGVAEILELDGHSVTLAHDGESAVRRYAKEAFDIGIFDVRMPGMNGVEAFFAVREIYDDAAIIMMSGHADGNLIATALANGALGLLTKPFEPDDLLDKIDQVMGHRRTQPVAGTATCRGDQALTGTSATK